MKNERGKQVAKTYNKPISGDLIGDIRSLIETARHNVAVAVNAGLHSLPRLQKVTDLAVDDCD